MAFPTSVNDAKSNKWITTPVSDAEVNEAFKKIQTKDSAGPITSEVLVPFVQFVSLFADSNGDPDATSNAMATQILNYLQGYDGANKRCTVTLILGDSGCSQSVAPSTGILCGWQKGCIGGINQTYGLGCQVTWN
jgi:hypothetical protein